VPGDSSDGWQLVGEDDNSTVASTSQPAEPSRAAGALDPETELDLCFICDCTGSMSSYIQAAQKNIHAIVKKITESHGANVRFGLISYRDHPPQERSYVTQCHPFTESLADMRRYVDSMSAKGGGDGPEAVTAGMQAAFELPWRPNATKVCVLIADAPPHGLEPHGDGFPNGDPEGRDPLEIARNMAAHNITIYTVGCEPALGSYRFARDFFCTVAELTGGQAVALGSAALLADVIINGSAEEICLTKLQREVEEEVLQVQSKARSAGEDITTESAVSFAYANLQSRGLTSCQMRTDGNMVNKTKGMWGGVKEDDKRSLASVKQDLCAMSAPFPGDDMALGGLPLPSAEKSRKRSSGGGGGLLSNLFGAPGSLSAKAAAPPPSAEADVDMAAPPPATNMMAMPAYMPSAPSPAAAAALAPQKAATNNYVTTDLISKDQVARIVQRAQCQNRLL